MSCSAETVPRMKSKPFLCFRNSPALRETTTDGRRATAHEGKHK